jgi:MFS family permease
MTDEGQRGRAAQAARPFYGWVVVACAFVVLSLGFGVAYSFSAFFLTLQAEFDASRGAVSLIFAISGALYFGLGALTGTIADRVGPRWLSAAGMAMIGVGLLLASRAENLTQIYVTYGLSVGLGVGFSYVPAVGAVQRWFIRRRGMASGFAVSGIGVGTLVMPLLATELIDAIGWRGAYVALAALAVVVGGGASLLIEHSPEKRGLRPDGDPPRAEPGTPGAGAPVTIPGASLREALAARPFWLLYGACLATSLGLFIPFVHLAAYATDWGLSEETGVFLFGLVGVGSIAGRFVLGGAADRWGRRRSLAATFAGMGLMMLWWLGSETAWSLAVFSLVFGACYGGFVALIPALATDYFGGRNAGGIIGVLYTGAGVGSLLGPTLAGLAFDLAGSYTLPIAAAAAVNAVALLLILVTPDPARWRPTAWEG